MTKGDKHVYLLSRRQPERGPQRIKLFALDPKDGRVAWQKDVSVLGTLAFADDILVASSADGLGCTALRAKDGSVLWQQKRVRCPEASRVVDNERLYTLHRGLTALDLRTGALLWRRKLPGSRDHYSRLIGVKGGLLAGGGEGHLAAFNLPAGTLRWRYRVKLRWYHQLRGLLPLGFGYIGMYRHAGLTGIQ